ncbi:hypothetical protein HYR54_00520 [Candidatus Acetothermia bacterium]|nr:hypothetical protein [Candidatus Acetothermia bacterium]
MADFLSAPTLVKLVTASRTQSLTGVGDFRPNLGEAWLVWGAQATSGGFSFTDGVNSINSSPDSGSATLITNSTYIHHSGSGVAVISAGLISEAQWIVSALVNGGADFRPPLGEAWIVTACNGGDFRLASAQGVAADSVPYRGLFNEKWDAPPNIPPSLDQNAMWPGLLLTNAVYLRNAAAAGTYGFVSAYKIPTTV